MTWWRFKRKIATLPNVRATPDVVLGRSLEKANSEVTDAHGSKQPTVKQAFVLLKFWDDEYAWDYSQMSISDMLMYREILTRLIDKELDKTAGVGEAGAPSAS